jgi:hypothetical protein
MRGFVWLRAATLALTSFLLTDLARAEQEHVSSLEAPTLDWPEARLSVEAELRASGFQVSTVQSSAVEPTGLLAELESAGEGLAGRVTIIRIGATGIAYVRVPSQRRTYRVLAPPVEPGVAAGMLALRVVELLSLHPAPPEKASRDIAEHPVLSEAPSTSPGLEARAGLGAGFGAGLRSPTARVLVNLDATLLGPLHAELYGAGSLFPGTVALDDGSATMQEQELGLSLVLSTEHGPGWAAAGGFGLALQCLQVFPASDQSAEPRQQNTCVALTSARLRAGFDWSTLGIWTMVEPGLSLPRVRLQRDDETIATLGLWVSATAGLHWQL